MTIVDANLLLYAYNADAPQHKASRRWLEELVASSERVGIPWVALWAFARIATNARLTPHPLTAAEAFTVIRKIIAQPSVSIVEPGPRHAEILERLVEEGRALGPLMTGAVLAALAVEHGATLASTGRGFSRFPGLRWLNPLDRDRPRRDRTR